VHLSAQRHDKRVDALAKLPARELQFVLTNGNFRQRLLAIEACSVALRRLRQKDGKQPANDSSRVPFSRERF
jgi:hypothetical protein